MMKQIVPDFYGQFSCKAETCHHTCCQGWEIDIDDMTAAHYASMPGPIGEHLRASMVPTEEGGRQFRLTGPEKRCPFLQADGLCQLILTIGEEQLCEICQLHPRFYEVVYTIAGPVELGGVGLCCEESCELLLATCAPLQFIERDTKRQFSFAELLSYLQIDIPAWQQIYEPTVSAEYVQFILDCLEQTEPINDLWTTHIQALQKQAGSLLETAAAMTNKEMPPIWNRIYQYLLYRQLERCDELAVSVLTAYAHLNTTFILLVYCQTGCLEEAIREWSEQIEYDTDNVDLLYSCCSE